MMEEAEARGCYAACEHGRHHTPEGLAELERLEGLKGRLEGLVWSVALRLALLAM